MSETFDQNEANGLLRNSEERAWALIEIFDNALESADEVTLRRILDTYPAEYLDAILCGYPDYLEEELGR